MALHLIIDGYNLIRQSPELQELDARELEAGRAALLARLAAYRERRPQRITVVFDGWLKGHLKESRDRERGLSIIFSRRGEKADQVIKRLLDLEGARAVVVTSDREIQAWAQGAGAAWINAAQFERQYLLDREPETGEEPEEPREHPLKKGPARRLPKDQRRGEQRLKKL